LNMEVFGVDAVVRPAPGAQLLFASVAIDYVSQGKYPGLVRIATGVSHIGRSSFTYSAGVFQDGVCVALSEAVTVYAIDSKGRELPSAVRAALEGLGFKA
ncbi:MAG: hypothetical protein JO303_05335, partial [Caulobacteraceae bacterium]|nr:hypothetical protein [Caulobacteraceae bacterium]